MDIKGSQVELLNQAIDTEQKGYEFYTQAASRAEDVRAKKFFRSLADDELYHRRFLEDAKKSASDCGAWSAEMVTALGGIASNRLRPNIIPDDPHKAAEQIKPTVNDVEAIEEGIRTEQRSVKFYTDAGKAAVSADDREAYEMLARWEQEHLVDLDNYQEYLTNPTSYWSKQDRPIMEG
jgi:rubrerythrin